MFYRGAPRRRTDVYLQMKKLIVTGWSCLPRPLCTQKCPIQEHIVYIVTPNIFFFFFFHTWRCRAAKYKKKKKEKWKGMFKQNFCASQKQVHNKRCPCSVLREAALDRSGTHVLYWCCEHCSCESFTWTDSYATSVSISPAEVVTLGRLASPPTREGGGGTSSCKRESFERGKFESKARSREPAVRWRHQPTSIAFSSAPLVSHPPPHRTRRVECVTKAHDSGSAQASLPITKIVLQVCTFIFS